MVKKWPKNDLNNDPQNDQDDPTWPKKTQKMAEQWPKNGPKYDSKIISK